MGDLTLTPDDRILVLAPHPDDESLGTAGIIQQAVALGLPVRVVFLTYGDNNQWAFLVYRRRPELSSGAVEAMGLVRHDEAVAAAKTLGLTPDQLTFLGYPDFGTLNIWTSHWGNRPPFRSMLTRVAAVPYANALRPGAPYQGEEILKDLTGIVREFKPTKIFVSHPADHNPDHLALYLFTRVALWNLAGEQQPTLYPYLVHYPSWPQPRGDHPELFVVPPSALATTMWYSFPLSAEQIARKLAALKQHVTQYEVNSRYLPSFVRQNELFSDYPAVRLRAGLPDTPLAPEDTSTLSDTPDALTDEELAAFVGLEWRTVRLDGEDLVVSLTFSRSLARGVVASIYLFGYRTDQPFGEMPKLHVRLSEFGYNVDDQGAALPQTTVVVTRQRNEITVRVPLAALAHPKRVLSSARTYLGRVPLDWVSWRAIELDSR